jgi:UDP-N-acetylglucosamine--N-acetylmuramyl-(pentapeptide) pyrophosphoryl-undecaprenol N-acetylglucosamine transferase
MALAPRAVVLAGGGTGGHIFPALALADAIHKLDPETRVSFMGTERGLETRLVPAAGVPLDLVPAAQMAGRSLGRKALGAWVLLRGILRARALLRARGAELVIGVGGYASVPAVAAAVLGRTPVVLLEPNARPGRANRALARFARAIFVQFEDARARFPAARVELLGYPVREIPERVGAAGSGSTRLLVLGGSQGARSLNQALCALLPRLELEGLAITHQTGAADLDAVRAAYASAGALAEVAAFFDDVPERLARADLVIARAGAATAAELCAAGVAAILVPYPHAADDHQLANARELERAGAARVVEDRELAARLEPELRALLSDPGARARLASAAGARGRPDAARQIWLRCRALAGGAQ